MPPNPPSKGSQLRCSRHAALRHVYPESKKFKVGPPPLRNPAYAPDHTYHTIPYLTNLFRTHNSQNLAEPCSKTEEIIIFPEAHIGVLPYLIFRKKLINAIISIVFNQKLACCQSCMKMCLQFLSNFFMKIY